MKGIAYSGYSGSQVEKIEISLDRGKTWNEAQIIQHRNV